MVSLNEKPGIQLKRNKRFQVVLYLTAMFLVFAAGMLIATERMFPFEQIRYVYNIVKYRIVIEHLGILTPKGELPVLMNPQEVRQLVSTNSAAEVEAQRISILAEFRGATCLHDEHIDKIEIVAPPMSRGSSPTANSILVMRLPLGFEARARHFRATKANRKLVIFNTGHNGQTDGDSTAVALLLGHGFDVVALDMPLSGENNRPIVDIERVGRVRLTQHNQLMLLASRDFNPLVLFVDPIACVVNHFYRMGTYDQIAQVGMSGGGFVSTIAAALDSRIAKTFVVAGAYPAFLRFANPFTSSGDYEQVNKSLLEKASDLDLYIMASTGKGREYVQVFNEFDPCCYAGRQFEMYSGIVATEVSRHSSGKFDAWLDKGNFSHEISAATLRKIGDSLNSSSPR